MVDRQAAPPYTIYQLPTTVFIVGPTASGKSKLAMDVALKHNGEIICADSQTIRRGLDIGTAKPTLDDQTRVKHHLIDIVEPYENFNVAQFKNMAEKAIINIQKKGKMPIVVGGSGLYVDALLYNFKFRPTVSAETRDELNKKSVAELQNMIIGLGLKLPDNVNNPRHLIRTLESEGAESQKGAIRQNCIVVGLNPDAEVLEKRIVDRIDLMFKIGFGSEVKSIISKSGRVPKRFDAIGYAIVQQLLDSEITEEEAKGLLVIAHRQYAKRQRSWFKRNKDIKWFKTSKEASEYIKNSI